MAISRAAGGRGRSARRSQARVDVIAVAWKEALLFDPNARRPALLRRLHLRPVPAKLVPAFAEEEEVFPVPLALVTGVDEVDGLNITIACTYESIAILRKVLHTRFGLAHKDGISFSRESAAILKTIRATRQVAAELRDIVSAMGYIPLPEPHFFSRPVTV